MAKWRADRQRAVRDLKKWEATIAELKVRAGRAGPQEKFEYTRLIKKLQTGGIGERGRFRACPPGRNRI